MLGRPDFQDSGTAGSLPETIEDTKLHRPESEGERYRRGLRRGPGKVRNADLQFRTHQPCGGVIRDRRFCLQPPINLGGIRRQVLYDLAWALSNGFLAGSKVGNYNKNRC